jgi:hypothetical protein
VNNLKRPTASGGHHSTDLVTARMPAEPLIQCHGLCGTYFVRSCSSQNLDVHWKHTNVYFALCIKCLHCRVGFVFRNVVVLTGTSTSMTFADVCYIRSIFNSLVIQQAHFTTGLEGTEKTPATRSCTSGTTAAGNVQQVLPQFGERCTSSLRFRNQPTSPRRGLFSLSNLVHPIPIGRF